MSTHERYIKQGQLGELRETFGKLEDRAEGILDSIRMQTFTAPLASALDLDAVKIANYADEYRQVHAEGARVRAAIEKLKEELGLK